MPSYHENATTQGKLFDASAPTRFRNLARLVARNDPATSALAAQQLIESGERVNQKLRLLEWMKANIGTPLTSREIADRSGLDYHGVARRLPDLEADGFVVKRPARISAGSGRMQTTWECCW